LNEYEKGLNDIMVWWYNIKGFAIARFIMVGRHKSQVKIVVLLRLLVILTWWHGKSNEIS